MTAKWILLILPLTAPTRLQRCAINKQSMVGRPNLYLKNILKWDHADMHV
jgi:hypothetical protein